MKLSKILLEGPIEYDPDFNREIDKLTDQGAVYRGSGDYGSVYFLHGKAYKITTDSDELDHAEILKGKKTNNFVHIYDVNRLEDKLGIIVMDILGEYKGEIPEDFILRLEHEAKNLGIDPEELDLLSGNFMQDPRTGRIKMVDV